MVAVHGVDTRDASGVFCIVVDLVVYFSFGPMCPSFKQSGSFSCLLSPGNSIFLRTLPVALHHFETSIHDGTTVTSVTIPDVS